MDPLIPDDYETITFRASGDDESAIKWELNGGILAKGSSVTRWPLQKGEHRLKVSSGTGEKEIKFVVK